MLNTTWKKNLLVAVTAIQLFAPGQGASACPTFREFEAREAHLENRLAQATECGALTRPQIERLRKKLDKVAQRLSSCKAHLCLNSLDSAEFDSELSCIGSQITHALRASRQHVLATAAEATDGPQR